MTSGVTPFVWSRRTSLRTKRRSHSAAIRVQAPVVGVETESATQRRYSASREPREPNPGQERVVHRVLQSLYGRWHWWIRTTWRPAYRSPGFCTVGSNVRMLPLTSPQPDLDLVAQPKIQGQIRSDLEIILHKQSAEAGCGLRTPVLRSRSSSASGPAESPRRKDP